MNPPSVYIARTQPFLLTDRTTGELAEAKQVRNMDSFEDNPFADPAQINPFAVSFRSILRCYTYSTVINYLYSSSKVEFARVVRFVQLTKELVCVCVVFSIGSFCSSCHGTASFDRGVQSFCTTGGIKGARGEQSVLTHRICFLVSVCLFECTRGEPSGTDIGCEI